jgi:hypothetical protein
LSDRRFYRTGLVLRGDRPSRVWFILLAKCGGLAVEDHGQGWRARRDSNLNLLIRRYPCGHPDPFRSVRDLGRVPVGCPCKSERLEGRSSVWLPAWLPAEHGAWHRDALVLVTASGPSSGGVAAGCPAQTPPLNPIAAKPGDGRVQSRPSWRVHEPCSSPEAVALRSQTVLTGSGSHGYSYGGFGGGPPTLPPACSPSATLPHQFVLSAWEAARYGR